MSSRPPRGYRDKNPLNIRFNEANQWRDRVLDGTPGPYEEFVSMAAGYRAAAKILTKYFDDYKLKTPREIVERFAPVADKNDVPAYLKMVESVSGFGPDDELDLHDTETMRLLLQGMASQEIGPAWAKKTWMDLDEGLRMAGLVPKRPPAAVDPRVLAPAATGLVALDKAWELAQGIDQMGVVDWIIQRGWKAALLLVLVGVAVWLVMRILPQRQAEA
jgi:hypothetical protein